MPAAPTVRSVRIGVVGVALALLIAGCSGGSSDGADSTTTVPRSTTTAPTLPPETTTSTTQATTTTKPPDTTPAGKATCAVLVDLAAAAATHPDDLAGYRAQIDTVTAIAQRGVAASPPELVGPFQAYLRYYQAAKEATKDATTLEALQAAVQAVDTSGFLAAAQTVGDWRAQHC